MLLSYLLPNFEVKGLWSAFWFLLILILLNSTIVPIISFLTLPLTIFTLGFFYLVINLSTILVVANFTSGVEITGNWLESYSVALIISICLTVGNYLVNGLEKIFS